MLDKETIYDVVIRLIGPINPVGETQTDEKRFESLKILAGLIESLLSDIDRVATRNFDRHEFSMKRAGRYANEFLKRTPQ